MASVERPGSELQLPRQTFAKLTPVPFLTAHLHQSRPLRPSGRAPEESRQLSVNNGSLTHCNGSAVARNGDTAVVCGVRAEISLASDLTQPSGNSTNINGRIGTLGLLIPNVELSTGCSPAFLPGNPPGTIAQSLTHRTVSLLYDSKILDEDDLKITFVEPPTDEQLSDETPRTVIKAYWALYIDILCIALDGNLFDTLWASVLAALSDTRLPHAWWDADTERVVCSAATADSTPLAIHSLPIASTFALFMPKVNLSNTDTPTMWVLADPDAFEEDASDESLTIVTSMATGALLKVEKSGATPLDTHVMEKCITLASRNAGSVKHILIPR